MGDHMDVDDMLEAPYRKEDGNGSPNEGKENRQLKEKDSNDYYKSSSNDRGRDRDRDLNRSSDGDRDRDRNDKDRDRDKYRNDRDRDRNRTDRDRDRNGRDRRDSGRDRFKMRERRGKSRSHSREKRRRSRSRSRDRRRRSPIQSRDRRDRRRRTRSPSRERRRRHTRSKSIEKKRSRSKTKTPVRELTTEERDARTVFCMQLSSKIHSKDLENIFSVVGKISDVRIITDAKTRRSKGIAYIEFKDIESVPLALGLSGQNILNIPILVQPTLAEKNRLASANAVDIEGITGPMRLYVGSLHFNISEDMLRSIFEPFGKIDHIQLIMDTETGQSKGYGFITFHKADDAKKALDQLNGFRLAGRSMKVNHVTERSEMQQGNSLLDSDDMERAGIDLGATGRLQLMAKLAEGTGLELPQAATKVLNMPVQQQPAPIIATQCFLLSNMFDPSSETNPNWAQEIRDDVVEECNKYRGVLHVFVDRQSSQGNVYVKCPTIATAVATVNSLHGRFFAGKMITAAYVPVMSYHSLFPDALNVTKLLSLSSSSNR